MRPQVRISGHAASSLGGLAARGGGDFARLKREAERALVRLEVPGGTLTVDRSKFTPAQEAYYQASQHIAHHDWGRAIAALRDVISLGPPPQALYGAHVMLGIAYFRAGDLDAAADAFRQAIALNRDDEMANLFLGTVLMLSRRFEEAVGPLEEARRRDGQTSHVNFYLGYVYSEIGRWEEAIAAYNAEIENHRRATPAYDYLAKLHYSLSQQDFANRDQHLRDAIAVFGRWTEAEPRNAHAYNLKGYLHADLGEFEEAINAYERAVTVEPDYVIALSNLGTAYLNAGRDQDAKQVLERVIGLGETVMREQMAQASENLDADVRTGMDEAYQLLGAACLRLYLSQVDAEGVTPDHALLDQAEAAFQAALRYNPGDMHALYNLGNVYYLKNRRTAAADVYSRVLELEPNHEEAANNLRVVREELERRRRWLEATVGRRAQESTPENPVSTVDLVETLAEARARLYEGVDPGREDDAFSPEDLLNAMLPVAEWLSEAGVPEARFDFAARIFDRGWLSSGKAARLAGVDRAFFLTNLHRVGVAALDLDEEEMENQSRYVNTE